MAGSIVFISIFGVMIIGLVIVAIYGSKKDRAERMHKLSIVKKKETEAKTAHVKIYFLLNFLLDHINESLADFDKDNSSISLGDENKKIISILNKINDSDDLKLIYKSDDRLFEFKPVFSSLYSTKPTNWKKDSYFAVSLVKNKSKAYKELDDYNDIYEKVSELKDEFKFSE